MTAPRRLDLRLAIPATAAWAAAALAQGLGADVCFVGVACLVGVATLLVATKRRSTPRTVALTIILGAAVGGASMAVHRTALERGAVAALARDRITVDLELTLVRDPIATTASTGRHFTVIDATATRVRRGREPWVHDRAPVTVFAVAGRWTGLLPGQRVHVSGALRAPRHADSVAAVVLTSEAPDTIGRPPWWQRWAGHVRDALRTACSSLPGDQRGLLPGLVLGDVSAMPPDLTAAFRVTGLTHLNAVSGANVAIVLTAVGAVVRRIGLSRRLRVLAAAAALAAFVVLVRPSPSVLRAAGMGTVVLVAAMTGRRSSAIPVLSAAVLALVLLDPFLARSPGFAMSVLATFAIVAVSPQWTDLLARRMSRPMAAAVAVPAAAQLACTPVIVLAFGQLTPLAIPANLLAAPAVAPATLIGVGGALVAPVAGWAAEPLAWAGGLAAGWIAVVARTLAAVPGAGLAAPAGWPGAAALLGVAVLTLLARRLRQRSVHAILGSCPP